jgi:tetratricopeptide (TPR) repeat protein
MASCAPMAGARTRARWALAALAGIVASSIASCGRREHATVQSSPVPLDGVAFAGCAAVARGSDGPICEIAAASEIHVWVPPGASAPAAFVNDALADAGAVTREASAGGTLVRIAVSRGARVLRIAVDLAGAPRAWSLALAPERAADPAVVDARAMRERGDLEGATAKLAEASAALGGADAADAVALAARIALTRGDLDAARRGLATGMEAHAAAGRISAAADDAYALVYLALEQRRFTDVHATLERAAEWSRDYFDAYVYARHYAGFLARETGDVRGGLRELQAARDEAMRLGLARHERTARVELALSLLEVGRADEALEELRLVLQSPDVSGCDRADAIANVGWVALCEADNGHAAGDPRPSLEAARATYRDRCADKRREANAVSNLAWAALQRGDTKGARALLVEAQALVAEPEVRVALFWVELTGRIALAERRTDAPRRSPRSAARAMLSRRPHKPKSSSKRRRAACRSAKGARASWGPASEARVVAWSCSSMLGARRTRSRRRAPRVRASSPSSSGPTASRRSTRPRARSGRPRSARTARNAKRSRTKVRATGRSPRQRSRACWQRARGGKPISA